MDNRIEWDLVPGLEVRSLELEGVEDQPPYRRIFGYSAVFNSRSSVLRTSKGERFVEVIDLGAFDGVDASDCHLMYDHRVQLRGPGNYEWGTDGTGLWYAFKVDELDTDHVRVLRKIERRDLTGSSFMFDSPQRGDFEVDQLEDGLYLRRLKRIRTLYDKGPVTHPAYRGTSAHSRSADMWIPERVVEPVVDDSFLWGVRRFFAVRP